MRKLIKLQKPYYGKKLHADTIKTILISPYQTAYRLYVLINEITESQDFIETKHDKYWVTAMVKTVAAPIGEARAQIWSITHLQPLLSKKPRYITKCTITDKMSNETIFRFENKTINENTVYSDIEYCVNEVEKILWN